MRLVRVVVCLVTAYLVYSALALAQMNGQQSSPSTSTATVPRLIQLKGSVHDDTGKPLSGNLGITFALYKDANDQVAVWQENQNVRLDSAGHYSVLLGATNEGGLPLEIFSAGEARWLGVRPGGQAEQPRILFLSVAYALKAADTEMLGGRPASAYVLADSLPSSAQLGPANAQPGPQILIPPISGSLTQAPQTSCSAITSDGTATANQIAKFTSACNIENSAIFESGGNVGIGTTSPAGMLDVTGTAFFRNSLNALGGVVLPPVQTATPTQGYASTPLDLQASAYNTSVSGPVTYDFRWQAAATGNDTSSPSATLGLLYGVPGSLSQTGISVNKSGIMTFASGQTFPGTGSGTVTSVGTGAGLTGGPITTSGTISVPTAGITATLGGTGIDSHTSTGVAQVAAGTWSVSTGLANGTTATTQVAGDNTTKVATDAFVLANAGTGTVTSVGTGAGLTGGPITKSGTISIPAAGVTNSMLSNSAVTVTAGSGLSGGGTVALGGTITLTNSAPSLGGTVTSVGSGTGLTGGPITTSGTLTLDTSFTDGRYLRLTGGTLTGGLSGTTGAFTGALSAAASTFSGLMTAAGALMPTTGTATASKGFNSNPLDWQASSFNSSTSKAVAQDFRWLAEPTGNNSSNPSGTLNLLFGSNGSSPTETGLSIDNNGLITFASGQTFPGSGGSGTVTSVTAGSGLTASPNPITASGTISIPPAGVLNSMLANSSITVAAGSGLSGGGTVALGGTVTLASNLSGTTDGIAYFSNPTNVTSTPAPSNGQILIGSTGNAPVLGTLTAGQNVTITNAPGSVTISAASGSAATLPFFVTGGERTGALQTVTTNVNKLWGFLLPYNVTTTQVTYDITTADNTANNYDIGIFDNSGNRVLDAGPTPGTTLAPSVGFHTLTWTQGSTALAAGRYYLAITTNCASACAKVAGGGTYVSFAMNASAGSSTGGALPSTLTPPADKWATGTQPTVVIQ